MNLKKSLVNSLAAASMLFTMAGSIALAADTDSDAADTNLNVTCPHTASVDVNVYGAFSVDATAGASSYNADLPGGFEIVLDLSCNWSNDFAVSADIGSFQFQGTAPSGTVDMFGGSHLRLDNGSGVYTGPTIQPETYIVYDVPGAGAPDVEGTVFEFLQTADSDVIENETDQLMLFGFIPLWNVPIASPGVTTATWDGHLIALPANLAGGTYTAPLTVTLTAN